MSFTNGGDKLFTNKENKTFDLFYIFAKRNIQTEHFIDFANNVRTQTWPENFLNFFFFFFLPWHDAILWWHKIEEMKFPLTHVVYPHQIFTKCTCTHSRPWFFMLLHSCLRISKLLCDRTFMVDYALHRDRNMNLTLWRHGL